MNVRTLCLAILMTGDSTGYEIRKLSTDGHYSHFVDASFGSIYPALTRMETEGLVVSREELQPGKPARKVYSITDSGRVEFLSALSKPVQKDVFKSEFLLLAMCAEMMQPIELQQAIDAQITYLESEIAIIDKEIKETPLLGADWVADYGRNCLGAGLTYIKQNRNNLEKIAGAGLRKSESMQAAE